MSDKDIKKIRKKLEDEILAACFGGGIGPAILDYEDIHRMSDDELKKRIERGEFKGII